MQLKTRFGRLMASSPSQQPSSRAQRKARCCRCHLVLVLCWVDVAESVQFTAEPVKFTGAAKSTHDSTTRPLLLCFP